MKLRRWACVAISLVVLFSLASCHHGKDDNTSLSFNGTMTFDIPTFTNPGEVYTFVPEGLSRSDGGGIGYYWTTTIESVADTTRREYDPASVRGEFTFEIPDTLTTFTVTCTAFAEGYYSASTTATTLIVKDDGSLTNIDELKDLPTFKDERDGREYPYVTLAGLDWFARNLSWDGAGAPYYDAPAVEWLFGLYYTYEEAKEACPEGWRLPTDDDWTALAESLGAAEGENGSYVGIAGNLMADAYFNEDKMWTFWPTVKITNTTGLSILPVGYGTLTEGKTEFQGFWGYGTIWTNTAVEGDPDLVYYRYVYQDKSDLYLGMSDRQCSLHSVRCVRESEDE